MKVSRTLGIATGILCAASAVAFAAAPQDKGESRNICVSPIFLPATAEQAKLLEKHAGALYDNAVKKGTPHSRMSLVYEEASKHIAAGKTVTLQKVPDTGTLTLADGSVRKSECYNMTIQ